jgi:hypothetical protein
MAYAGIGDFERAFERLEESYQRRDGFLVFFRHMAQLVPGFLEHPKMIDLLTRIGVAY